MLSLECEALRALAAEPLLASIGSNTAVGLRRSPALRLIAATIDTEAISVWDG
jgi:hypothetical protein